MLSSCHKAAIWATFALLCTVPQRDSGAGVSAFSPGNLSTSTNKAIDRQRAHRAVNHALSTYLNRRGLPLYDMVPRDDGGYCGNNERNEDTDDNEDEDEATQSARRMLEGLMADHESDLTSTASRGNKMRADNYYANPSVDSNSVLHPDNISYQMFHPPPPTAADHARLEAEINYLESLVDSDDALTELWSLWFNERGADAAKELQELEKVVTGSAEKEWPEAERRLRAMIEEQGVHWAEPINLLATHLRQQERYREAKELFEIVLSTKPWHFGAVSGIVRCCDGLGDEESAKGKADAWALPPLRDGTERRRHWVEKAVAAADMNWKLIQVMGNILFEGSAYTEAAPPPKSSNMDDEQFDNTWQ